MPHISFSEIKNWHKCAFYHKLVNIDKIKLFKGNEYTAFGTAIHDTCESMLLNEKFDVDGFFIEKYKESLKKLASESYSFDKKLVLDMKFQGLELIPYIKPELKNYFGEYKVFSTEERLFEDVDIKDLDYKYKGYVDLVLQTPDGKYHIIDWKSCSWGWNYKRKIEKMTTYQLTYYKHYFSKKHNIPLDNIETHFALLKRTAKKNKVEIFKVSSGNKKIKNALNFLEKALYNIGNKNFLKNRLSCTYCEFYKTKHCP
tara:strand:+ start:418 stop:1188 length:771 start_codon:yes stop_codon:yes gene_type:complete